MIPHMLVDFRFFRHPGFDGLGLLLCALSLPQLVGCSDTQSATQAAGGLQNIQVDRVIGESGSQLGQFIYPRGMDIFIQDGVTCAAVVDKTARLQIINLESGKVLGSVHTPRWDRGKPTGLTVHVSAIDHTKLALYVADTHEHRVLMYELPLPDVEIPVPTEPDLMFGSFGEEPDQFIYPTDIAIELDDQDRVAFIYVSEYGGNDRVNKLAVRHQSEAGAKPLLEFAYQIGIVGEEVDASDHPEALARPQSIELWDNPNGTHEIILTDASHHRVGRFTTEGELIAWYGDPMDVSTDAMRFPYGLTVLDDSTALVAEFGGNRIRCIDLATGETIWQAGQPGRSIGQLAQPWAVGVHKEQLVILDSGNSRLQVCDLPSGINTIAPEYTKPHMFVGGITP
jgi:hypothetical protein